jgi:hypothetical protein
VHKSDAYIETAINAHFVKLLIYISEEKRRKWKMCLLNRLRKELRFSILMPFTQKEVKRLELRNMSGNLKGLPPRRISLSLQQKFVMMHSWRHSKVQDILVGLRYALARTFTCCLLS